VITTEQAKALVDEIRAAADESAAVEIAQRFYDEAFEDGVSEILTTDPPKDGRPE
jgi:hypothetical protein